MATRLGLYNAALGLLGERKLASLTENRGSRRDLDTAWDDGFIDFVLEQGLWNFAMRTAQVSFTPDITTEFGYSRAFDKPSDWIRTAQVSGDEYFSIPLDQHADEAGHWWADIDVIYVQYVSNLSNYGSDLSRWPQTVAKYAGAQLAFLTADKITGSTSKEERMERLARKWLGSAQSKDAMNQPRQESPKGAWVNARRGGLRGRDYARGSLIG